MAKQDDSELLIDTIMDEFERNNPYEVYNGGLDEYEDSLDYVNLAIKGVRLG